MNNPTDAERIVKEENEEIWNIITANLSFIPDFTRTREMKQRWRHTESVVWLNIHRELIAISVYEDIMGMLNSSTSRYDEFYTEGLVNFVESFPTLVWILLLANGDSKFNSFKLLVAAGRLDFIDVALSLVNDDLLENNVGEKERSTLITQLAERSWPKTLTDPIIVEIRDINTALRIYNYYDKTKSAKQNWRKHQVINLTESLECAGCMFYGSVGGFNERYMEIKTWIEHLNYYTNDKNKEAFEYYITQTLGPEGIKELSLDAHRLILMTASHVSPKVLRYLLAMKDDRMLTSYVCFYTTDIVNLVEEMRPGDISFGFDQNSRGGYEPLSGYHTREASVLRHMLDLGFIKNKQQLLDFFRLYLPSSYHDETLEGLTDEPYVSVADIVAHHPSTGDLWKDMVSSRYGDNILDYYASDAHNLPPDTLHSDAKLLVEANIVLYEPTTLIEIINLDADMAVILLDNSDIDIGFHEDMETYRTDPNDFLPERPLDLGNLPLILALGKHHIIRKRFVETLLFSMDKDNGLYHRLQIELKNKFFAS